MTTTVIDRRTTGAGEIVLRRASGHLEIIIDGVFCMSTRSGASERLLVRAALEGAVRPASLLIGGLGVGYSLAEAVSHLAVAAITVVEIEPAVVAWHRDHLAVYSEGALDDPRVEVVVGDLIPWVDEVERRYDAICVDIDNGPGWTVRPGNAAAYGETGLDGFARLLAPGGTLAVWSAAADAAFRARLERRFAEVGERAVPVERGEPDRIYLARRRR